VIDVHISARAPNSPPANPEQGRSWRTLGACQGQDPAPFYRRPYTGALSWCQRCAVAECCLFEALVLEERADQRHGAWGATTPTQRHQLAGELASRGISPGELLKGEQAYWEHLLADGAGPGAVRVQAAVR